MSGNFAALTFFEDAIGFKEKLELPAAGLSNPGLRTMGYRPMQDCYFGDRFRIRPGSEPGFERLPGSLQTKLAASFVLPFPVHTAICG